MKLGAFIITFNRPLVLKKTLFCLLKQTCRPDLILVVDNGASIETEQIVTELANEQVLYHSLPENRGPAGGIAYALQWFANQPYDWIYWGDDDDPPKFADDFEQLSKLVEQADSSVAAVGAVGGRFNWNTGEIERLSDTELNGVIEVDGIAGGSQFILRRDVIHTVGIPETRFFFGFEEKEYCLRLRRAGYRLLVDGNLMLKYRVQAGRLGIGQRPRSLVPRPSINGIWRQYYSTRNMIFMMHHTFHRPDLARREAFKAMGRSLFSWLRGPRYGVAYTRLQLQGVWDGYVGRMGRTVLSKAK